MNAYPEIRSLHHVAIHVSDLREARDFYENIIGLLPLEMPEVARSRGIVWYRISDYSQLHVFERNILPPRESRAHLALEVSDVDAWRKYLVEKGISIELPTVELYDVKRFFIRDPSGNLLEFVKW